MKREILRLNQAGTPTAWLNIEEAVTVKSKGQVIWELGGRVVSLRGGVQSSGSRSQIDVPAIIAVSGRVVDQLVPEIKNPVLFARDEHMCLYCGKTFRSCDLSRDHVIPKSRGGADSWENSVTSCRRCNGFKADRTPEEAGMELLAIPFRPNIFEWTFLSNRNVLADQMEYLKSRFQNVLVA